VARRSSKKKTGLPAQPRPKAPPPIRSTGGAGGDRRRLLIGGGIAALVVVAAVLALVLTRGGSSAGKTPRTIPWGQLGPLQTGPPPWNNGSAQLTERLAPLGLSQLSSEGTALHIHGHLDVYVNGKKVTVPAGIGIYDNSYLTELHTHDTRGVIHIESPHVSTFTLGQLFGEWGVKLTPTCIGRYCGRLQWWVNGEKRTGDPANLAIAAHQEVAIAFGPPPLVVPKSYKFAAGE
jgi:hypothetical protein